MKGLLVFAIFAVTTSVVFGDVGDVCKGQRLGKRVNHPNSCDKFVVCIGGGVVVNCPQGTHFNKDLEVCDWLERAGCADGGSFAPNTDLYDPFVSPNKPTVYKPPVYKPTLSDQAGSQNQKPPFAEACRGLPLGKRINHPESCEKFVVCIGGGVSQNCPPGTHFSKRYEVCDWIERAECA